MLEQSTLGPLPTPQGGLTYVSYSRPPARYKLYCLSQIASCASKNPTSRNSLSTIKMVLSLPSLTTPVLHPINIFAQFKCIRNRFSKSLLPQYRSNSFGSSSSTPQFRPTEKVWHQNPHSMCLEGPYVVVKNQLPLWGYRIEFQAHEHECQIAPHKKWAKPSSLVVYQ